MKIFVLSDTHGNLNKAGRIYNHLTGIDLLIHCGDYLRDGKTLSDSWDIPAICVRGNCDGVKQREYAVTETPAGKILITHGHMEGVKQDLSRLLYLAEEQGCIAACFGHTHLPLCQKIHGVWLINPGSLSDSRDGGNGSFAIIHATKDAFLPKIILYDDFFKDNGPSSPVKKTPKKAGGFLRDLFNYSDRF